MEIVDLQDWQAFCQGDDSAMERLYHRHSPALFSFCLYLCGDRTKSEDIVQDSFMSLMAQREGNKISRSVRSWLFATARNLVYNLSRRISHQSLDSLSEDHLATNINPDINLIIDRIISSLPPDERELLLLREHQGFSVSDIAQMLNLSKENVRIRLYRIRKRIQEKERTLK